MPYHDPRDPYAILGIPRGASAKAVKDAYRALARRYHPDLSVDARATARMQDVNWAYSVLNDPLKRSYYDATHAPPKPAGTPSSPPRPSTPRPSASRSSASQQKRNYTSYRAAPVWNPGPSAQPAGRRSGFLATATIALIFFMFRMISGLFSPSRYEPQFSAPYYNFPFVTPISTDQSIVALGFNPISPEEMRATQFANAGAHLDIPESEYGRNSVFWQLADRYLSEYGLTDENGMTDEVAYAWIGEGGYVYIRTRSYGTFRLSLALWDPSFLTPTPPTSEDQVSIREAGSSQAGCATLESQPESWGRCRSEILGRP